MTRKNGNKTTVVAETVEAGFINPIAVQLAAAGFIIPDQGGVAEEQEALKAVTQAEGRAESPVAVMGTSNVMCLRRAVQAAQATLTLGEELAGERASLLKAVEAGQQERLAINKEAGQKIAPIEALIAEAEEMGELVSSEVIESARAESMTLYREAEAQMKIVDNDLQKAEQRLGHIEADAAYQTFAQRAQAAAREAAEKARAQLAKAQAAAKAGRLDEALKRLKAVTADGSVPAALRQEAADNLTQAGAEIAAGKVKSRIAEARAHVQAGDHARAIQDLKTIAGDPALTGNASREVERALARAESRVRRAWARFMDRAERTAEPGDELWTLGPWQAAVLRPGPLKGRGQPRFYDVKLAMGLTQKRFSSLPRRARRKPWRDGYPKMPTTAETVSSPIDVSEVGQAIVDVSESQPSPAATPWASQAVEAPSAPADWHTVPEPDWALKDYLAELLAAGCEVDLEEIGASTTVLVQTPEGSQVVAIARIHRQLDCDRRRLRAENLVRDLQAGLARFEIEP
jgi:tetratricopeptide (TPR) repeat protein